VLAVGIVVDDAIVVVESVQHYIEEGLPPREATFRAMEDVAGPIVGVGAVLSAVFIPCAFLPGIVGQFFKQFALTIAVSTLISTFNSLTLSPALCAILLKPKDARPDLVTRVLNVLCGWLFWVFNRGFKLSGRAYVKLVGVALRVPVLVLAGYAGLVAAGAWAYQQVPTGFIPQQDKGYLIASIQLPDAAAADRTREVIRRIVTIAMDTPGVKHCNSIAGNSFVLSAYGSNFGSMFIILDDFDNRRHSKDLYADQIMMKLRAKFAAAVPEGTVSVFGAPAVSGLGRAGGFRIMIEDRGDVGPAVLQGQTENFIDKATQQKQVVGLMTAFKTNSPQIFLDVDREACLARGVELADVYATLQATMGSRYVNDFNAFGRTWQVNVQSDQKFRNDLGDIKKLKVRNRLGEMVPLAAVLKVQERTAPLVISRYNMYPAAAVNGNVAPGVSTGDAIGMMEQLAEQELPKGRMGYEWTELTFVEKQSRNTGVLVFALSVAFVFLVLAALYESWAFPLAVILVVPVCVSFSVAAVWLTNPDVTASVFTRNGLTSPRLQDLAWQLHPNLEALGIRKQDVNIFTQVGFVVLIGLACKNAILIVEFAKVARDRGAETRAAILDACKLRFRPIIMTSTAFILGVLPLAVAQGAGSEMRQALGIAVLGGMVGVTVFGIVLTPVFFFVVDRLTDSAGRGTWLTRLGDRALYVLRLRFLPPVVGGVAKRLKRARPTGS
jgi:multidrug efflux pump